MKDHFKKELLKAKLELSPPPARTKDLKLTFEEQVPIVRTMGYKIESNIIKLAHTADSEEIGVFYYKLGGIPKAVLLENNMVSVSVDTLSQYTGTWKLSREDFDKAITDYISKFEYVAEQDHSIRRQPGIFEREYKAEFIDSEFNT